MPCYVQRLYSSKSTSRANADRAAQKYTPPPLPLVPLGQLATKLADPQMRAARIVPSGDRLLAVTSQRLAEDAGANVGSANRCQEGSGTVVLELQFLQS